MNANHIIALMLVASICNATFWAGFSIIYITTQPNPDTLQEPNLGVESTGEEQPELSGAPQFSAPEFPLGTITVVILSVIALAVFQKGRRPPKSA